MKDSGFDYQNIRCPNVVPVIKDQVEFYTDEHGKNRVRVTGSRVDGERVCGSPVYEILKKGVFTANDGYDPAGMKVRCKFCKGEYYVFPKIRKVKVG